MFVFFVNFLLVVMLVSYSKSTEFRFIWQIRIPRHISLLGAKC